MSICILCRLRVNHKICSRRWKAGRFSMAARITYSSCHILNMVKIGSLQELQSRRRWDAHPACQHPFLRTREDQQSVDFSHGEVYEDEELRVEYICATSVAKIAKHIIYKQQSAFFRDCHRLLLRQLSRQVNSKIWVYLALQKAMDGVQTSHHTGS